MKKIIFLAGILSLTGCETLKGYHRENGTVRTDTRGNVTVQNVTINQSDKSTVPALSIAIGATHSKQDRASQAGAAVSTEASIPESTIPVKK